MNYPGLSLNVDIPNMGSLNLSAGFSDIENHIEMNTSDHFRIASISKTFSAAAILQLYDQNLLSLNDTVNKYIKNITIPNGNVATIYNLLHMNSGIPDYIIYDINPINNTTPYQLLGYIENKKPLFEPGNQWNYCNTNFLILGIIVEIVSGQSLQDYLQVNIFTKYNLQNTYFPDTPQLPIPYSQGYSNLTGIPNITQYKIPTQWTLENNSLSFIDTTYVNPQWTFACGNMVSNIFDITRWAKLLFQGKVFTEKGQKALLDFSLTYNPVVIKQGASIENYANKCNATFIGKNGLIFGFNSQMIFDTQTNVAATLYLNYFTAGSPSLFLAEDIMCIIKNYIKNIN